MDRYLSDRQTPFYVRDMDDFLILTEKRWPLRGPGADLSGYLDLDGLVRHPDKTQTGRRRRGFDWGWVQFTAVRSPRISDQSLTKHCERGRCWRTVRGGQYGPAAHFGLPQGANMPSYRKLVTMMSDLLRYATIRAAGLVLILGVSPPGLGMKYDWPQVSYISIEREGTDAIVTVDYVRVTIDRPEWEAASGANNWTGTSIKTAFKDDGVTWRSNAVGFHDTVYEHYTNGHTYARGDRYKIGRTWEGTYPLSSFVIDVNENWPQKHSYTIPFADYKRIQICSGASTAHFTSNGAYDLNPLPFQWGGGSRNNLSGCLVAPPISQWCALTTPTVTMDFGTMNVANAHNKSVTSTVNVSCTSGMKYLLRLGGDEKIPLSNGMNATLTAHNKPLGSSLEGIAGTNEVPLAATLSGNTGSTGPFNGSGVLFVTYP